MKFTTTGEPLTVPKKPPGDIPVRPTRAWHLEPVDKVGMSLPQPAAGEAHTDTDDRGGSNKRGWNIFGALHSKSGLK